MVYPFSTKKGSFFITSLYCQKANQTKTTTPNQIIILITSPLHFYHSSFTTPPPTKTIKKIHSKTPNSIFIAVKHDNSRHWHLSKSNASNSFTSKKCPFSLSAKCQYLCICTLCILCYLNLSRSSVINWWSCLTVGDRQNMKLNKYIITILISSSSSSSYHHHRYRYNLLALLKIEWQMSTTHISFCNKLSWKTKTLSFQIKIGMDTIKFTWHTSYVSSDHKNSSVCLWYTVIVRYKYSNFLHKQ